MNHKDVCSEEAFEKCCVALLLLKLLNYKSPMEIIIVVIDQYVFGFDHDF